MFYNIVNELTHIQFKINKKKLYSITVNLILDLLYCC